MVSCNPKHLWENRMLRKNAFYLLLAFLAVLTTYDVVKISRKYINDNTDTDMFVVFNDTMTMPNVTFCMFKNHAWSHFKTKGRNDTEVEQIINENLKKMASKSAFLDTDWDDRMVVNAYYVIQMLNSMERETSPEGFLHTVYKLASEPKMEDVRQTMEKWLKAIHERGISFEEFQQKVGYETLKRSLKQFDRLRISDEGQQLNNRVKVKITWISMRQLCFQPLYDPENFWDIDEQDQFFTVALVHSKANYDDLPCMTVDFHGRPSEEARYLQGKGRTKDGVEQDLCLGLVHELEVEVKEIRTSLPDAEENEQKCRKYAEGDKSELNCRSRCKLEMIQELCHCTAHTMSYLSSEDELRHYPPCDYAKCQIKSEHLNMSKKWDDENCGVKCYPDCDQLRYRITRHRKEAPQDNMTQLTLFWGSFEYLRLIQKEKLSPSKFMSQLGGSIGVWLGLSVLSIIQFIIFLMARAHRRVTRKETTEDGNDDYPKPEERRRKSSNPFRGHIASNPLHSQFGAKKKH